MKENRNIFGFNVWRLLFSFVAVYVLFFSEKGQERIGILINLFEFSDNRISDVIVRETDIEK